MLDGSQLQNVTRRRARRTETLNWICFYNEERLREELNDLPRAEYEQLNIKTDM